MRIYTYRSDKRSTFRKVLETVRIHASKGIVAVVLGVVVLGGGLLLLHAPTSPFGQKAAPQLSNASPSKTSAVAHVSEPSSEQSVDTQEEPLAPLGSLKSNTQAEAVKPPDSTQQIEPAAVFEMEGKEELPLEVSDELEKEELLQKLAKIGFDSPEQQEELASWPLPVLRWQVENLQAKLDELIESGALKIE